MADTRSVAVRLLLNPAGYVAGAAQVNRANAAMTTGVTTTATRATAATAGMTAGMKKTGASIANVGAQAGLLRGGLVSPVTAAGAAVVGATKAAIDWESSWAGVTKTVDGTDAQLKALEGDLRGMAKSLPATHGEIASVAEAAGQLGVETENVAEFSRVMIDLGETTNLSADQAATSLARFSNIMGTSQDDVERLGSTIVDLGNNSETTEAEIVELGTRMAAAGNIAGLSESDVLGFAAALTSAGVRAEAGGTAMSKVFTTVRDSVLNGGDALETFAEVAGVSAKDFSESFREDPAQAISAFIGGLGEMNAAGQSTSQVFETLELTDQRLMRSLLSLAESGDLLTESLDLGSEAWRENTALAEEAEKRYGTTAAQLSMAMNTLKDAAIDVGGIAVPVLAQVAGAAADLVSGLQVGINKLRDLQVQAAKDAGATDEEASQTRTGFLPMDVLSDLRRASEDVRADVEALSMGESFWSVLTDGYEEAEEAAGFAAKYDAEIQGLLSRVPEVTEVTREQVEAQVELNRETVTGSESLAAYQDQLRAATDPVFALFNAVEQVDEAQTAYNEAVDEYGKKSPEAATASVRLAEAVAGAEQAAIDGDLSFDAFDARLQRWVEQGVITAEQAKNIRGRVKELRKESEDYEGSYKAQMEAGGTAKAEAEINGLINRAKEWDGSQYSATVNLGATGMNVGRFFGAAGLHTGGPIMHDGGPVKGSVTRMHSGGLRSDERHVVAQKGEFMMQRSAVSNIGLPAMHAMNEGRAIPIPAGGGGHDTVGAITVENHIEIGGEVVRVVSTEISEHDRQLKGRVRAGTGRAR